jgi:hypothetical protein
MVVSPDMSCFYDTGFRGCTWAQWCATEARWVETGSEFQATNSPMLAPLALTACRHSITRHHIVHGVALRPLLRRCTHHGARKKQHPTFAAGQHGAIGRALTTEYLHTFMLTNSSCVHTI